jgi:3-hydroxyisobutyrate dehydrogenase-like beta-hydroxyacid dehydrogenase
VTRVAFLGLGAMGAPMAGRLLDAGHDLTVWNRTPARADALVARGATAAATPAEAARDAEVVVTMVADPPALDQVIEAVAGSIDPGAVLVEMSTVGPTAIRSVAEGLAPVRVLDAPVLGSVPQAEAGSLTILVGGDRDALARCAEVLEAIGRIVHVGPAGAGATVKLANNAAGMSALVALGEVLSFTDRAGLDPEAVLDALGMGPLASFVERWRPGVTGATGGRVDFRLVLARKDLALAADEAQELGVRLQMVRDAIAACDEAIAAGLGEQDNTAVARHVRTVDRPG